MGFKYRELADAYIADIRAGALADGLRLPSIRTLSAQHGVSITTALKTYELLEAEGYLRAQPQSGFFVRRHRTAATLREPSLPDFCPRSRSVDRAALIREIQLSANDTRRVPLGTVMLAPGLLPIDALQRSLVRSARRGSSKGSSAGSYGAASGEPALLDALRSHCADDGIHLGPDDLQITNGCMNAVSLAIHAVTRAGEGIAIPSPCFSGQLQLLASLGRRAVEIPSTAAGIDLDSLEETIAAGQAQAVLVTANFQNPLGYCATPEEKRRIASFGPRYGVPIIEDDVFAECGHQSGPGAPRPLPIKCWDEGGYVLWCGSFSKTLAPGYRIGWCTPGRYAEALRTLHLAEVLAVNSPLQLALADFIHGGEYRRHLRRLRVALGGQVDALRAAVGRHFPATCRVTRPAGGYALWVQLPVGGDGLRLYAAAKESGINIVPGTVFSTRDLYRNYIRLNAGNPWSGELQAAVERLGELAGAFDRA
jgi:DNA-binding transcriptional MocR family regulator